MIIGRMQGHCWSLVEASHDPWPGHSLSLFLGFFSRIFNRAIWLTVRVRRQSKQRDTLRVRERK